ncbi:MAG: hypothetical protein H0V66_10390 [Bdellovibrionales bacterium]|nr:hypothetical protein [Bdellovibrionales bacterium]
MFKYQVVLSDFPYTTIWRDFAWPMSVTLQKFLFKWWKYQYLNYHVFDFALHCLNAFLLSKIAEKLKLPYTRLLFLFFLLHPSNVITVAWMIQLKTLLSFFFALISFYCLIRTEENKKWYLLSWLFFTFSLLSKSASIPLPVFFLFFVFKKVSRKELLWLIPFFILSALTSYQVINSKVTKAGIDLAPSTAVTKVEKPASIINAELLKPRFITTISTFHYYFWQSVLPVENRPVKGLNYFSPGINQYLHVVFIILIVIITWGSASAYYLGAGYLMILPFMGLIRAPFMNVTWISDQHLYLALPFFICFWLSLISRIKVKYAEHFPLLFIPFFCYQVATTTPYYQDDVAFYSASLEADALNVPIAYNLAMSYISRGKINEALEVTGTMVQMAQVAPEILSSLYYPDIFLLHMQLQNKIDKKSP